MKGLLASKSIAIALMIGPLIAVSVAQSGETRVPVTITGGHETDRRDGGRPVVLVAGALGVRPEVFREAFSRVRPARGEAPSSERVNDNKRVLLEALGKYGITNERLDEVSNYYRYRPERGELWPTKAAEASAIVKNGRVIGFVVTNPGSGYSSVPTLTIAGMPGVTVKAKLTFDKRFALNGSIGSLSAESR